MTDVFKHLDPLKWRGLVLPLTARSVSFAHEDARHKFQYKDGEFIDSTGAKNWTFSYTIPFREDIATGPYLNLFTETMPKFIEACRNRSRGPLWDPVLGYFDAKCVSFSATSDVNRRDGDDIQVEFVHAPEIDVLALDEFSVSSLKGLETDVRALDEEVEKIDWEQEAPPEPLVNPIAAISGLGRQVEQQGNKLSATLDDTAARCEDLEQTIDRLENPQTWELRRSSRRTRDSAYQLKERLKDPQRKVVTVTLRYAQTVSEVANNFSMTVVELMQLNPLFARTPGVKANTPVNIYESNTGGSA